jgi:predicted PurR-regulated permease PerM
MYEHRKQRLLTRAQFAKRVLGHFLVGQCAVAIALGAGVLGYHAIAGLGWVDSLLNASMILGGMGPVDTLKTDAAKVFASIYALFSGLVFIGILGVLLAPFVHRIMHKLHMDEAKQ